MFGCLGKSNGIYCAKQIISMINLHLFADKICHRAKKKDATTLRCTSYILH